MCAREDDYEPIARKLGSEVNTQTPFNVVYTDVMGPMKPASKGGAQFVVTFNNDFSKFFVRVFDCIESAGI